MPSRDGIGLIQDAAQDSALPDTGLAQPRTQLHRREIGSSAQPAPKVPHEKLSVEGARVVEVRVSGGTHVQGHRRWFVRFMRRFGETMRTVHGVHPVLKVRIEAD